MVFYAVVEAANLNPLMWIVLVAGIINTVFSLFYYLRVIKFMFFSPLPEDAKIVDVPVLSDAGWYVLCVSLPVFGLGIFINWMSDLAHDVAKWLL
jgi:NADH-quinone oxidoreductase subunit N